jgi:putative membrane-bound dehydrogenase-like protein
MVMKQQRYGFWAGCLVWVAGTLAVAVQAADGATAPAGPPLRVLFLGDDGHHRPEDRFRQLQPVMAERGIELVYTPSLEDLNPARLLGYDAVAIFANHTFIQPSQEKALMDFVKAGGGLVPLHCASYCFLNSPAYIDLVGGQFLRHGTGVFRETFVDTAHPVMQGLKEIESWDETYVHTKHNTNRIVLSERRDATGSEPYTWVRDFGQGRVFYTAWGHDQRTWSNTNFHALVENGIRWASAHAVNALRPVAGLPAPETIEAPSPLPNYRPGRGGDPIKTMQKPMEPAQSAKYFATLDGFEAKLFASEPDIVKAIWLDWDLRGRLWIAETVDYPNELQPEGQGRDRIKICEDTDGDGRADKFTIFADKLSVPTGFVFAKGGLIVVHSGLTEFFRDTDGDDRADERKVLFKGWNMGDTHATASNLRYGFDNWIWGTVGYSGFNGTVGGKQVRFGQGFFRFRPDGSELEFIRSSNNNTWGLGLTEDNLLVGSTANGNASMYMPIPNRYYEAVRGWSAARLESIADSQRFFPLVTSDKVRQVDFHGQYTAAAGSAIYTARSFPKEYWNTAQFVCEPTGHLIGRFNLHRSGADFIAYNSRNFAASTDEWTSPVCAEVGPDGALWVSDWYNYIIQHNPTPRGFGTGKGAAYETPLRDKTHGRIYRIVSKSGRLTQPLQASKEPLKTDALVAALKHENLGVRLTAQRLLVDARDLNIVQPLLALVADTSADDIGLNPGALHALWTLHGLGAIQNANPAVMRTALAALRHPVAAVRRAAIMVLPASPATLAGVLQAKLLQDADPQVRLAAFLGLADQAPSDLAAKAVFEALQNTANTEDRWLPEAATAAAARSDSGFLRTVLAQFRPATNVATAAPQEPVNAIGNPSFETANDGRPAAWRPITHNGRGEFTVADVGRTGGRAVKITSTGGGDLSWAHVAKIKPRTDYLLRGWIKTEGVKKRGNAQGAMFNIHELQDAVRGGTGKVLGDSDWTQVELAFNSGQLTQVTVNCLFGGWGQCTGTAWFDDVELIPAPGSELGGEVGRIVRSVTSHYAARGPSDTIVETLVSLKGSPESVGVAVLDGLVNGWPRGTKPTLADADKAALDGLIRTVPTGVRDRLLALALRWGEPGLFQSVLPEIAAGLRKQLSDSAATPEQRLVAARQLIGLQVAATDLTAVVSQINVLTAPALATGLVNALSESREAAVAPALLGRWNEFTPGVRRAAVFTLMRRAEWAGALLNAIEKGSVSRGDVAADQWTQLKANANRDVADRATKLSAAMGAVSADREEIVKRLLPLAKEKGDLARGKAVYVANCAACHVFEGAGGKIGPELTGIGARDRGEILTDILDPNRSVEANFRLWTVTTKDGEAYSGRLETETQTTVEILDTAAQKHVIQRKDIASMEGSAQSIMPAGFDALPADDLKSLLEYLAASVHK